jgi:ABC-type antimicrobial peptide transport system permease subunit
VNDLRTQEEQVDRLTAQEALFARLSGFFGVVTLILAGVGLYGLLSYLVLRRTVSRADPATYSSVGGLIIAVALVASLLPAFRAARVDPMTAFRTE